MTDLDCNEVIALPLTCVQLALFPRGGLSRDYYPVDLTTDTQLDVDDQLLVLYDTGRWGWRSVGSFR